MTHELKQIFKSFEQLGSTQKAVLASVVALEGSSYRRPGVRMLLWEEGSMVGAVSGGCVEKEIQRQAEQVFASGIPRMMSYDGRYRLGCEGLLYILLEPFNPGQETIEGFTKVVTDRKPFELVSNYGDLEKQEEKMGTVLRIDASEYPLDPSVRSEATEKVFHQSFEPCFRIVILGGEHDAVILCRMSANMGWEVHVVTHPTDDKTPEHFRQAESFHKLLPEDLHNLTIDPRTAVILMTHSFARDLNYLTHLRTTDPAYLGILGPKKRREKLMDALIEQDPGIKTDFLDGIYGPAGLDLGAETPQEIAISILSEILAVTRDQVVISLRDKKGNIHSS